MSPGTHSHPLRIRLGSGGEIKGSARSVVGARSVVAAAGSGSPSLTSHGWVWTGRGAQLVSPDCLVLQPAGVTLLVACFIGGLELLGRSNDGPGAQAGLLGLLKGQ